MKELHYFLPAFFGNDLHDPSPLAWIYLLKISSSSSVHLPFFNPTFSQHGALPILSSDQPVDYIWCIYIIYNIYIYVDFL